MSEVVVREDSSMLAVLTRAVADPAVDVTKLQALWDFKRQVEAAEAEKQYTAAMALFKSRAIKIARNQTVKQGPLQGTRYPDLFAVVDAVTPALSECGLSASWRLTKDEKDWIEVTCTITHIGGHRETFPQGGPPDTSGGKNAIQTRASTKTYLERYTLLGALGMTAGGIDDDGSNTSHVDKPAVDPWTPELESAAATVAGKGPKAFQDWWKEALTAKQRSEIRGTPKFADFYAKAQEKAQ